MNLKTLALGAAVAASLAATQASAAPFYINYTGTSLSTNVSFTAHLTGNETNGVATSISGDRNGVAVTGLSSYAGATQHVTGTFPYTDFGGISFTTFDGNSYNFYISGNGNNYELTLSPTNQDGHEDFDAQIDPLSVSAAVPEPATWGLMLAGFGMIGFSLRSRKRQAVRVTYA